MGRGEQRFSGAAYGGLWDGRWRNRRTERHVNATRTASLTANSVGMHAEPSSGAACRDGAAEEVLRRCEMDVRRAVEC